MNNRFFYLGSNNYTYDWAHLLDSYKKIVNPQSSVLEIGSSNPVKTSQLVSLPGNLIGLEKHRELIPNTKGSKVKIINGDWSDLKKIFKDKKFDVVVASHVIEHVEDDLSCLNQTYDLLKDNGYFLFTTPNKVRLFERLRSVLKGERKFPYHEHLKEYEEEDIKSLLLKSKFFKSKITIKGVVFGLHAGPLYLFLKHPPRFLRQWANFWEVVIQKV